MGKDLWQNDKARDLMLQANAILGFNITDIMFNGTSEELRQTKVTQPAVFLHSVALALCSELPEPEMVAGHSLGEFSALVCAGALSFEDGLRLVSKRAEAMQKCCESKPGAMAAVIGLDSTLIENVCREISVDNSGVLVAANYNSAAQTVISGEKHLIDIAEDRFKEMGAKRVMVLATGGAFHSPLMEGAAQELAETMGGISFNAPLYPVYQNFSAKAETDPKIIRENLLRQLTGPVKWEQSVKRMIEDGAEEFTEIGPGKVLQGLVSRIAAGHDNISVKGLQ